MPVLPVQYRGYRRRFAASSLNKQVSTPGHGEGKGLRYIRETAPIVGLITVDSRKQVALDSIRGCKGLWVVQTKLAFASFAIRAGAPPRVINSWG